MLLFLSFYTQQLNLNNFGYNFGVERKRRNNRESSMGSPNRQHRQGWSMFFRPKKGPPRVRRLIFSRSLGSSPSQPNGAPGYSSGGEFWQHSRWFVLSWAKSMWYHWDITKSCKNTQWFSSWGLKFQPNWSKLGLTQVAGNYGRVSGNLWWHRFTQTWTSPCSDAWEACEQITISSRTARHTRHLTSGKICYE